MTAFPTDSSACSSPRCWCSARASAAAFGLDDVGDARPRPGGAALQGAGDRHADASCAISTTTHYRDIRFRPEKALWRAEKLPFELMFFHQGRAVPEPVRDQRRSSRRASGRSRSIRRCSTTARTSSTPQKLRDLGFAGFRVHYPLNKPGYKDEVLVFQGASYFRARRQGPGLRPVGARPRGRHRGRRRARSSRASSSSGSSGRAANATSLTIYALLDSQPRRRRLPLRAHARAPRRRCR